VQPQCVPRLDELGIAFDMAALSAMPSSSGLW
jgi:hypothetical protein